eukprot:632453-Pyramimonas_sp.AAC.1
MWITERGKQLFAASGHADASRGVEFLVHRRRVQQVKRFEVSNERIVYIDINFPKQHIIIVTACFPHSGYADLHMQHMYDHLGTIHDEAVQSKQTWTIARDFKSQVGRQPANLIQYT